MKTDINGICCFLAWCFFATFSQPSLDWQARSIYLFSATCTADMRTINWTMANKFQDQSVWKIQNKCHELVDLVIFPSNSRVCVCVYVAIITISPIELFNWLEGRANASSYGPFADITTVACFVRISELVVSSGELHATPSLSFAFVERTTATAHTKNHLNVVLVFTIEIAKCQSNKSSVRRCLDVVAVVGGGVYYCMFACVISVRVERFDATDFQTHVQPHAHKQMQRADGALINPGDVPVQALLFVPLDACISVCAYIVVDEVAVIAFSFDGSLANQSLFT